MTDLCKGKDRIMSSSTRIFFEAEFEEKHVKKIVSIFGAMQNLNAEETRILQRLPRKNRELVFKEERKREGRHHCSERWILHEKGKQKSFLTFSWTTNGKKKEIPVHLTVCGPRENVSEFVMWLGTNFQFNVR